ncbi:MAG: DUF1553 domain-containing protein [Saprospiraceae bacterium]
MMKCLKSGWALVFMIQGVVLMGQDISKLLPTEVLQEYNALITKLDYNKTIKPILSDKCFACHGNDANKRQAELRLDKAANAYGALPISPDKVAIKPFDINQSELVRRILTANPDQLMPEPKSNLTLTPREKALLIKWIEQGAEYQPHWAFLSPVKTDPPAIKDMNWPLNAIDHFIGQKLEMEGLVHNAPASKEIILRRLSLDLTGLPPSLEDLAQFKKDTSFFAYEKQVDRLLQSPHYGERMAVDWLDLARYADSHGYTVDRLRDMTPYRDWVIQAYNDNLRYDQFIQQQLAGDLMPHPTKQMIIATAFNRNHPQNMEGGIVEEEFQTEYVIDRTNTTAEVFMGLSFGCARCHDHKFDPISQKNYYELFSFFNNVKESGQIAWNNALPTPTLLLPSEEQEKIISFIQKSIDRQEDEKANYTLQPNSRFDQWVKEEKYRDLGKMNVPRDGLIGQFDFEDSLCNVITADREATILRENDTIAEIARLVTGDNGMALMLDGDAYLYLKGVGIFGKADPFSISLGLKIPTDFEEGVLLHKCIAERLYNFKGYHLYYKNGRIELSLAHTAPSNAITKCTIDTIPKDQWIQLVMTYDGSSRAAGARLYLDGAELKMETTMDQLTKDILFHQKEEPPLQIGGWWRGKGFKQGQVDDVMIYNRTLTDYEIKILSKNATWKSLTAKSKDQLTPAELTVLKSYFMSVLDTVALKNAAELTALRKKLVDTVEHIPEIMVMQEYKVPKQTRILHRGDYSDPGDPVYPNVPDGILPFDQKYPKNRYGLAQWLTDANHPLTARVIVNRAWQSIFGTGLVKTSEDFGFQGEAPSHPELLDWLAVWFVQSDWDYKKLIKMIVMSSTYRQDSRRAEMAASKDPENRFLSSGPANRLTAEMLRDNVLFASGMINCEVGGKSIKPYQPPGLWEINSANYIPDSTQLAYKRSMYITVKRSVPNPTMSTFDSPDRSQCLSRRQKTNTPLQALVLLNDPTYLEAALVLGVQMSQNADSVAAIKETYTMLTARDPSETELKLLVDFYLLEFQKFKKDATKAAGWLTPGLYKIDAGADTLKVAANAVLANMIMNSDATITKR